MNSDSFLNIDSPTPTAKEHLSLAAISVPGLQLGDDVQAEIKVDLVESSCESESCSSDNEVESENVPVDMSADGSDAALRGELIVSIFLRHQRLTLM